MTLEVYLQSAVLRGVLVTNQERLSNYLILREGDEVLSITNATLDDFQGKTMAAGFAETGLAAPDPHQVRRIVGLSLPHARAVETHEVRRFRCQRTQQHFVVVQLAA